LSKKYLADGNLVNDMAILKDQQVLRR